MILLIISIIFVFRNFFSARSSCVSVIFSFAGITIELLFKKVKPSHLLGFRKMEADYMSWFRFLP